MPVANLPPSVLRPFLRFLHGAGAVAGATRPAARPRAVSVGDLGADAQVSGDGRALRWAANASLDYLLLAGALEGFQPVERALDEWSRVLRPGGWAVLALAWPEPEAAERSPAPWRLVAAVQSHRGFTVHETSGPLTEDARLGSRWFIGVLRRADPAEPSWAQPRLSLPECCRDLHGFSVPPGAGRVAIVRDPAAASVQLRPWPDGVEAVELDPARVNDPADACSKASLAAADLVVDLAGSDAGRWAASFDVDLVTLAPAPAHRPPWPRQHHVSADQLAQTAQACLRERLTAGASGVSVCLIVRNEERNLPACLGSVASLADELVVVDTGSTDRTPEIAREHAGLVYFFPWIDDFAWARNRSLERARRRYTVWVDADDVIVEAEAFGERLAAAREPALTLEIHNGDSRFRHVRALRTDLGFRFCWMCHEWPVLGPHHAAHFPGAHVRHRTDATDRSERRARNASILRRQVEVAPEDARSWAYLGRELYLLGLYDEAVEVLERAVDPMMDAGSYRTCVARRNIAACRRRLGDRRGAREALFDALKADPRWAETYVALADDDLDAGRTEDAIRWYRHAAAIPRPDSGVIIDLGAYTWRPLAGLAQACARRGRLDEALAYLRRAHEHRDHSWEIALLERLRDRRQVDVPCPLCGNEPRPDAGGPWIGYVRCPDCGVAGPAAHPPPPDPAEDVADVERSLSWRAATRQLADRIAEEAAGRLGAGPWRVLELMSAAPVLAARLAQRGHRVTVVDRCPEVAQRPDANGLEVCVSAWESFEVPAAWEGAFDLVVLVHALEHLDRLVEDLARAVRCLRPGGWLFSRHADQDSAGGQGRYHPKSARWILDGRSTEELARRVGLELVARKVQRSGAEADCWFRRLPEGADGPQDPARSQDPEGTALVSRRRDPLGKAVVGLQPEQPSSPPAPAPSPSDRLTARLQRRTYGGAGPCVAIETGSLEALDRADRRAWRELVHGLARDLELPVLRLGDPDATALFQPPEEPLAFPYFDLRSELAPGASRALIPLCEAVVEGKPGSSWRVRVRGEQPGDLANASPSTATPSVSEAAQWAARIGEHLGLQVSAALSHRASPQLAGPREPTLAPGPQLAGRARGAALQRWQDRSEQELRPLLLDAIRRYGVKFMRREVFDRLGWKAPLPRFERFWKRVDGEPVLHDAPFVWDLREALQVDHALLLASLLLWRRLQAYGIDVVGGMETSSIPLLGGMLAVNRLLGGPPLRSFYLRKERKKDDLRRILEGARVGRGTRVAIVDDILNKGWTKRRVLRYCEDNGLEIGALLVVIDTELQGRELFRPICPIEALLTRREVFSASVRSWPSDDDAGRPRAQPPARGQVEPATAADPSSARGCMAPEDVELVRLARDTVALVAASGNTSRPCIGADGRGSAGYSPFLGRYLTQPGVSFVRISKREYRNGRWFNRKRGCMCINLLRQPWECAAEMTVRSAVRTATRAFREGSSGTAFHKPIWPEELGSLSVFVYVVDELIPISARSAAELRAAGHDPVRFGLIAKEQGTDRHVAICGDLVAYPTIESQLRVLVKKLGVKATPEQGPPEGFELIQMRGRWLEDPARPKSTYF